MGLFAFNRARRLQAEREQKQADSGDNMFDETAEQSDTDLFNEPPTRKGKGRTEKAEQGTE